MKQELIDNMSDTLIERFKVLLRKNRDEDALSIDYENLSNVLVSSLSNRVEEGRHL